jgi:hypothetical protein
MNLRRAENFIFESYGLQDFCISGFIQVPGVPQKTGHALFDFMKRTSYKSYRNEIKTIAFRKDS